MKDIVVNSNPKSAISENIKMIRTNLKFASLNKKLKTIMITSSMPNEGKSFISSNLAASYAKSNEHVLLIDCDLRRGKQHEIFDLKNNSSVGLSSLLIEEDTKKSIASYIQKTKIPNLHVLTMGIVPPNPSELLESEKTSNLIQLLKNMYDIIILDCTPVIGLNDAVVLSKISDAAIVVARQKKTPIEMLNKTVKTLKNVNANIAGVVLNGIDYEDNHYYHNDYYNEYYK